MTTYTRPLVNGTPTTGQVVKAGHVNEPIDQIYDTILAGGITADQIAVGAVDTSELATAAVTAVKMDGTLPDASEMATSAAPTIDKQLANKKYVDDQDDVQKIRARGSVASNGTLNEGFNVTTARDSTGIYTVTFGSNFANTNYAMVVSLATNAANNNRGIHVSSIAVGSIKVHVTTVANAPIDNAFHFVAFGTQ